MWQLYALGAVFTSAAESVFDKAAVIQNTHIDPLVATFWRPFLYAVITAGIGITGIIGPFHFFFHWSLFIVGFFGAFTSLAYTYLLRKIELTSISSIGYLSPIVLLFIDTHIAHIALTTAEITGVLLLVLGGLAFTLDASTFRFKKEFTTLIWAIFLFELAFGVVEAYLFKHFNAVYGVNGVSFLSSLWAFCTAYILLAVLVKGKAGLIITRRSGRFIASSFAGKSFDAINSVLWAQALTFAAVSQVAAFEATYPLALLILVFSVQGLFKVPLGEQTDRAQVLRKVIGTILLVVGGFLAG